MFVRACYELEIDALLEDMLKTLPLAALRFG